MPDYACPQAVREIAIWV